MEAFFTIHHRDCHYYMRFKDNETVRKVKEDLQALVGRSPDDIRLFHRKKNVVLSDSDTLESVELTASDAQAHEPADIDMVFRKDDGDFHDIDNVPLSELPPLPAVMEKKTDNNTTAT